MNPYEAKIEAKKQRYAERAVDLRSESNRIYNQARSLADMIPFGQPILVGHHSEGRDRRFRNRIGEKYEKAFETAKKADHYAQKAASVGTGGISSDDPDAVDKLREKLASLEHRQAYMKTVNATHKKFLKDPASLDKSDLSEAAKEIIRNYVPRYSWEPHPFAPYEMTNNNANIKRVKERIAALESRAKLVESLPLKESETGESQAVLKSETINGLTIEFNLTENRLLLFFPGKPSASVREVCKRNGFRWSPTRCAWSRSLGGWAESAAEAVKTVWLKESAQ